MGWLKLVNEALSLMVDRKAGVAAVRSAANKGRKFIKPDGLVDSDR